MGTIRTGLRVARLLADRLPGGVAPSRCAAVPPGDHGGVDTTVVTVDFLRAGRLRWPAVVPIEGAAVLPFARTPEPVPVAACVEL